LQFCRYDHLRKIPTNWILDECPTPLSELHRDQHYTKFWSNRGWIAELIKTQRNSIMQNNYRATRHSNRKGKPGPIIQFASGEYPPLRFQSLYDWLRKQLAGE